MNLLIGLLYALFKCLPLSVVRFLGRVIGCIVCLGNSRAVTVARKNISLCCPHLSEQQQRQLLQNSSIEMAVTGLELFKVWAMAPAKLSQHLQAINNETLYLNTLASGKPVILAVPHLGNWEVVGLYCAKQAQMTSMYAPIKYPAIDKMVKRSREASGANLVPASVRGVMAMLKALRKGEQVGILPDQKAEQGSGIFSPFFGVPAYTMTLVNTLQAKSDAVVIMAFAERVRGGWSLHFKAPEPEIYSDDLQTSVDAMNRSVENCVRQCPEQYQWEYKRFRQQPDGSNLYKKA